MLLYTYLVSVTEKYKSINTVEHADKNYFIILIPKLVFYSILETTVYTQARMCKRGTGVDS